MGRAGSRISDHADCRHGIAGSDGGRPRGGFRIPTKVLMSLAEFAEGICASVKQYGSSTKALGSLDAQAQLKGLTKKLADVGFDAKGKYWLRPSKALLKPTCHAFWTHRELQAESHRAVSDKFPAAPMRTHRAKPTRRDARAFPLDEYITTVAFTASAVLQTSPSRCRARRTPGRCSMPCTAHSSSARCLLCRSSREIPPGRHCPAPVRWRRGLAANLKLRDYVDRLLAEFHFVGPRAGSAGTYIREAVLEVHAIDPASGEVRKVLEIREKGGGATAEQSPRTR